MSLTKRLCSFLAGLALCGTCLFTGACAEAAAPDRWQGEYQAYGRTIKVDTEITVPEKTSFPILAVETMKELSPEDVKKYEEYFYGLDKSGSKNCFRNTKYETHMHYYDHKGHPDLSNPGLVTTPAHVLPEYDPDKAYAEDNDLTVNEALNLVRKNIQLIYPSVDFRTPADIVLYDRTKYRKSGKKLEDKGSYEFGCAQLMDGIPVVGSIHDAFRHGRTKQDMIISRFGGASAYVTDENDLSCSCQLWDTVAELGTPDHLLPFDTVKQAIEEMIMSGNIRCVRHIDLGYAQYDLPEGSKYEYVLIPAWVLWVEWADDSLEELETDAVNGTGFYTEAYYYKPIIVDALTGKATNPNDESEGRMLLPESYMKWVADQ